MKITLQEHGGFAALNRRPKSVDTAHLPADQAAEGVRLVAAARSAAAPDSKAAERVRDGMSYDVTIDDGGASTTLSQSDGALTPAFAELLDWIRDHASA